MIADMTVINPFDFFIEEYAEHFPFNYTKHLKEELAPYLCVAEESEALDKYVAGISREKEAIVNFLVDINSKLANEIQYGIRLEPGVQTCEETLSLKKGRAVTLPGCWCKSCASWD